MSPFISKFELEVLKRSDKLLQEDLQKLKDYLRKHNGACRCQPVRGQLIQCEACRDLLRLDL